MTYKFVNSRHILALLTLAGLMIVGCKTVCTDSMEKQEKQSTHLGGKERQAMDNADRIRLEHVAINVENPEEMAKWYCTNLGMKIVRQGPPPVNMRFISDAGGNMMLEIYHNPPDSVPDYASMDPLLFHIAFMVDDVKGTCRKLI
ncbi:MAG: VOC family protein, partial [Phycisphaerales bacterium]